jgi:hypothetical protein
MNNETVIRLFPAAARLQGLDDLEARELAQLMNRARVALQGEKLCVSFRSERERARAMELLARQGRNPRAFGSTAVTCDRRPR